MRPRCAPRRPRPRNVSPRPAARQRGQHESPQLAIASHGATGAPWPRPRTAGRSTLRAWRITAAVRARRAAPRRRGRVAAAPTGPTGTATPTSTRPRTARSSATPASCGGPRATPRTSRGSSATSPASDVLEVGCGAGQCSRWVRDARRPRRSASTCRYRQLQHSRRIDDETGVAVPSVLGTATALPFADDSFDVVFCSFGALQFVATSTTRSPRRPGCCGPAVASRSRSPTRPGGCSPTTRARPA